MYYDVSSFRYMMQEKMYSLRRSSTTLPHPFYMKAAAPLAEEVYFASGVDSRRSKNTAPDSNRWTPPGDDDSFLRFSVDEVTE